MKALRDNSNIFKWYILDEVDSYEDLKKLERFYIKKFQTYIGFDNPKGYNATLGGDGCSVNREKVYRVNSRTYNIAEKYEDLSEVERKYKTKIHIMGCCQNTRDSAYGDVWYYKSDYDSMSKDLLIQDIDYRVNKIFLINKNYEIICKYFDLKELRDKEGLNFKDIFLNSKDLGYCFAKDFYNKKYSKGLYTKDSVVLQYDSNGSLLNIFLTLHEAESRTGVYRASIVEVCNKKKKSAGGFQWRYISEIDTVGNIKAGMDGIIKEVSQYTIEGDYLKTFKSITDAAKSIGIDSSSISKVCRGKKQTTAGFRWCYGSSKEKLKPIEIYENNQKKSVCFVDAVGRSHIFESINEASRQLGVSSSFVSKSCKNNKKSNWFFI